jgi:hypothetical protein
MSFLIFGLQPPPPLNRNRHFAVTGNRGALKTSQQLKKDREYLQYANKNHCSDWIDFFFK